MAGAPNVLVARLRTLGLKFMVLSGLMLGVSGLVAWQLRSAIGAVPAYSAMVGLMPLMAWVGLGWSAWLTWSPKNHPTLRRLERASPGATSRLLDTFDGSAFVIARDPLWVSREAAVLFMPWSFEARFMDELAWVHPTVTKVVTPLHSSQYLSLTLRFRRAPDLDIGVSEDELKALNRMLTEAWPRVVVGWSEEREKLWMRDRERFGTHAS